MHVNPYTTLAQRPCTLHWQPHHTQHYTRLGPYEIAKSCHAILLSFLVRGHGGPWEIRCMTSTQAWNRTHNVKINVWQMKRWLTCCWHKGALQWVLPSLDALRQRMRTRDRSSREHWRAEPLAAAGRPRAQLSPCARSPLAASKRVGVHSACSMHVPDSSALISVTDRISASSSRTCGAQAARRQPRLEISLSVSFHNGHTTASDHGTTATTCTRLNA